MVPTEPATPSCHHHLLRVLLGKLTTMLWPAQAFGGTATTQRSPLHVTERVARLEAGGYDH